MKKNEKKDKLKDTIKIGEDAISNLRQSIGFKINILKIEREKIQGTINKLEGALLSLEKAWSDVKTVSGKTVFAIELYEQGYMNREELVEYLLEIKGDENDEEK